MIAWLRIVASKRLPSLWAGVCAFMGLLQLLSDVFKAIMGMAFALCSRRKVLTYENSIYWEIEIKMKYMHT
jgi:hypothetical protein